MLPRSHVQKVPINSGASSAANSKHTAWDEDTKRTNCLKDCTFFTLCWIITFLENYLGKLLQEDKSNFLKKHALFKGSDSTYVTWYLSSR